MEHSLQWSPETPEFILSVHLLYEIETPFGAELWEADSLYLQVFFTPHACSYLHHNHHLPLYYWRLRTSAHKCTFSVSVIPLQNPLYRELVPSSNCNSFMNHFSLICLLAFVSVINFSYHLFVLSCFVWYGTALIISLWLFGISLNVTWEKKVLSHGTT